MRETTPLDRCKICGGVASVMIYEHGIDENGDRYEVFRAERWEHTRRECDALVALAREEWPTLF